MCFLFSPLHCHGVFVPICASIIFFSQLEKSLTLLWRKEAITSAEVSLSAKFNLLIPKKSHDQHSEDFYDVLWGWSDSLN